MPIDYKLKSDSTALFRCCDEIQFEYMCAYCYETMGCSNCDYDMGIRHECKEQLSTVTESYPHPVGIAQEYAHTCNLFDQVGTIHSLDESPTKGELAASPTIGRTMFSGGYTESYMG